MKNYIKSGQNKTFTAAADLLSGAVVEVGTYIGVNSFDVLTGAEGELAITGVYSLPKTAALVIADGDAVYWDGTAVTKTGTDADLGTADADAAGADTHVNVLLKGGPRAVN